MPDPKPDNGPHSREFVERLPPPAWIRDDAAIPDEEKEAFALELTCRAEELTLDEAAAAMRDARHIRYRVALVEHIVDGDRVDRAEVRHYEMPLEDLPLFLMMMYERYGGIPDVITIERAEDEQKTS